MTTTPLKAPRREVLASGDQMGVLTVIGVVGRYFINGTTRSWLLWAVECGVCGQQDVLTSNVVCASRRHHHYCRRCCRGAQGEQRSVKLPDGRSIRQIAQATGLRLDTVYHRYIRGWPHHLLGMETLPKGTHHTNTNRERTTP